MDQRGTTRPPERIGDAVRVGALAADLLERLRQRESQVPPEPATLAEERQLGRAGRKNA
ncbi:MAG: hypothetical protein RBU30_17725 [Polyangia bacterium]|nr:hypothetical protein [Polyangia bacterium]